MCTKLAAFLGCVNAGKLKREKEKFKRLRMEQPWFFILPFAFLLFN